MSKTIKDEYVNGNRIVTIDLSEDIDFRLVMIKNDIPKSKWAVVDYVYNETKDIEKTQKIITIMQKKGW